MKDLFGLPVSQAVVLKAAMASADILQPTVDAIGQAAVNSDVLHADETGLRVAKTLHWLHVLATDSISISIRYVVASPCRAKALSAASRLISY